MKDQKPKILLRDSYLAMIENSIGTRMFRSLWAEIDGEKRDILQNGMLSCSVFASSLLYLHGLVDGLHARTASTRSDMEQSGWQEVSLSDAKPGAVIIWKARTYENGAAYPHIGFYLGNDEAVSTDYEKGEVVRHPLNELNGSREVDAVYRHPSLDLPRPMRVKAGSGSSSASASPWRDGSTRGGPKLDG